MGRTNRDLEPYLRNLRCLPFIESVRATDTASGRQCTLELGTPTETVRLATTIIRTHMTEELANHALATTGGTSPQLLLGPTIGRPLAERLEQAGLNFMDRGGNCFLNIDDRYVARIQGQRPPAAPTGQKGMRAPAYQALFAILADPGMVQAPIRTLGDAAGVSRQAAADIRTRLVEMDILFKSGRTYGWVPHRARLALDMLAAGYATTLRPHLLVGRFRTRDANPAELEARLAPLLEKFGPHGWGGGSAANRMLDAHYHGPHTTLHVWDPPEGLGKELGAIPDARGPLHIFRVPGRTALGGATRDTVHPLLVYLELLTMSDDRGRATAAAVAERWLPEGRYP